MTAIVAGTSLALAAWAQPYPAKPVRVIVNFPPGAGTDIATRLVSAKLTELLGQQFVVDNRAGAAGNIGVELAARAAPDGYTLLTATAAAAISQSVFSKIAFDLVRDFTPVAMIATSPFVLAVHPSLPVKSVAEFIALAKARPGALSYATPGTGSSPHLAGELLKMRVGIDLLHVPYKGMVPAVTDVIGGNVSTVLGNTLTVMPHVRAGRLRAIGISSGSRSVIAPELPTIAESGVPGFESGTWYGLMAPARTPGGVVARLNDAVVRSLKLPDVREKLIAQGAEPIFGTSAQMGDYVRDEIAKWSKVAKASDTHFD